ncbi:hypothetical protein [Desulfopila sp. IMCC35006]|nr:hypothetical protein [Desulfopila sp. IMCC35006]
MCPVPRDSQGNIVDETTIVTSHFHGDLDAVLYRYPTIFFF